MQNFDHFDFLAPIYDRVIKAREPDHLIQLAGLPVEGALLDAGGGTGRIAKTLSGYASSIIVADLSLGMLRHSQEKDNLLPVSAHTERLPFPDNYFERVIMVDALHHVCDQNETADELWRVLKPGGRIVIEEPDIRTLSVKFIALFEKIALMRSRFLAPQKIDGLFSHLNAHSRIESEGYNAWVIIEKEEPRS